MWKVKNILVKREDCYILLYIFFFFLNEKKYFRALECMRIAFSEMPTESLKSITEIIQKIGGGGYGCCIFFFFLHFF
jgi:hypothetical protein